MRFLYAVLLITLAITVAAADDKPAVTTLTGIIDQQGKEFVLSGEDAMQTKALLRASGFSDDNFARFVGLRVEVRGELRTEGDRRILIVKRLEDLKKLEGPTRPPAGV
jgi:hypothetical protein